MDLESKEFIWLKYRWEFTRRNKENRKDHQAVENLYKAFAKRDVEFVASPEFMEARQICKKWGMVFARLLDPEKTFEQLIEKGPYIDKPAFDENDLGNLEVVDIVYRSVHKYTVIKSLMSDAVKTLRAKMPKEKFQLFQEKIEKLEEHDLLIYIDYSKINSITALKDLIRDLIDEGWEEAHKRTKLADRIPRKSTFPGIEESYELKFETENIERKRKRLKNPETYKKIIIAGDLEREGKTQEEIAKIMFPNAFDKNFYPEGENNPETARRKVSKYIIEYKQLIEGGFKDMTFP